MATLVDIVKGDDTLQDIIKDYTFESGVRQLERNIMEICKKYIVGKFLNSEQIEPKEIDILKAREYHGDYHGEEEYNTAQPGEVGVVNKMSVLVPSGAISRLEIALVKGNGQQILSDNLIGTTKWTFKTVFGLLRSKASDWGIDIKVFEENNFYIHYLGSLSFGLYAYQSIPRLIEVLGYHNIWVSFVIILTLTITTDFIKRLLRYRKNKSINIVS